MYFYFWGSYKLYKRIIHSCWSDTDWFNSYFFLLWKINVTYFKDFKIKKQNFRTDYIHTITSPVQRTKPIGINMNISYSRCSTEYFYLSPVGSELLPALYEAESKEKRKLKRLEWSMPTKKHTPDRLASAVMWDWITKRSCSSGTCCSWPPRLRFKTLKYKSSQSHVRFITERYCDAVGSGLEQDLWFWGGVPYLKNKKNIKLRQNDSHYWFYTVIIPDFFPHTTLLIYPCFGPAH